MQGRIFSFLRRQTGVQRLAAAWLTFFLVCGSSWVDATTWFVNPGTGNDSNNGTSATVGGAGVGPFLTINHALSVAASGDTINASKGLYTSPNEAFPIPLKSGVALIGAGSPQSYVVGPSGTADFNNGSTAAALASTTRLSGFTIENETGSNATESRVEFLIGAPLDVSPQIDHNRFVGDGVNGDIGINTELLGGTTESSIHDNSFTEFTTTPTADLESPFPPAAISTGYIFGTYSPTIQNNSFTDNGAGVFFVPLVTSSSQRGTVSPLIDSNSIDGAFFGIWFVSGGNTQVFSPTITNNQTVDTFTSIAVSPIFALEARTPASKGVSPRIIPDEEFFGTAADFDLTISNNTMEFNQFSIVGTTALGVTSVETSNPNPGPPNNSLSMKVTGNQLEAAGGISVGAFGFLGPAALQVTGNNAEEVDRAVDSDATIIARLENFDSNGSSVLVANNSVTSAVGNGISVEMGPESPESTVAAGTVARSVVIGGNTVHNAVAGLVVGSKGFTTQPFLVNCNSLSNNETGAIQLAGSDPTADFGGGGESSPGNNDLSGNNLAFDNENSATVEATNNWWGTTNQTTIQSMVLGSVVTSPALAATPVCTFTPVLTDISLTKTGPSTASIGTPFDYTFSVHNNGPDAATGVVINDTLPSGLTFDSGSAGCSAVGQDVTCTVGTLANGASASRTITVTATRSGTFVNTAVVSGDDFDPTPANSSSTAQAATVAAVPVPTTGEWGLIILTMLLATTALWTMRRRKGAIIVLTLLLLGGFAGSARAGKLQISDRAMTLSSTSVSNHVVTFHFSDGSSMTASDRGLMMRDLRVTPEQIEAAQAARAARMAKSKSTRFHNASLARGTVMLPAKRLTPKTLSVRAGSPGLAVVVRTVKSADGRPRQTIVDVVNDEATAAKIVEARAKFRAHIEQMIARSQTH